jgi:hypothetical protein
LSSFVTPLATSVSPEPSVTSVGYQRPSRIEPTCDQRFVAGS